MPLTPSQEIRQALVDIVYDALYESGVMKCCLNCKAFNEQQELCGLCNPPARPPARVITFGCQSFDEVEEKQTGQVAYAKEPDAETFPKIPSSQIEDVLDSKGSMLNPIRKVGGAFDYWDDDIPF